MAPKGLLERLKAGENVIVAEGYLFEFQRRGYLKAGTFVPEVVIEHPDLVRALHEEFVHAGSDVVLAFTYYGHREKMRFIGREHDLESLNIKALKIARQVADETNTLMAGNICNTTVFDASDPEAVEAARKVFKEQIEWSVQEGADFIVAETFDEVGEALLAVECIKKYGNGLPMVVSLNPLALDKTTDDVSFGEACRQLEEAGADVVGLNCGRGPSTMLPLMKEIREHCKGQICMLPVAYRCTPEEPNFQSVRDKFTGKRAFPDDLPAVANSVTDIIEFAQEAKKLGIQYVGICCGNASHYLRALAEEYGRKPPASRYTTDISLHYIHGDNPKPHIARSLRQKVYSN